MKTLAFTLAMLAATPAMAKDVTITLNDQEQQALLRLIDAGVKTLGVQGIGAASMFINKLQMANAPTPPATSDAEKKAP